MVAKKDKRQEHRLGTDETVFIEVASAQAGGEDTTSIVISYSIDISANGLQVIVDHELPCGGIYQICVQLEQPERRLHLIGEVKWSRLLEDDAGHLLGISLFESEDTDIQQWKEMIAERFG